MLSRWTDFLMTDGEKEWRDRESEFEKDVVDRATLMAKWDEGWSCFFNAIGSLKEDGLRTTIYITLHCR